MVVWQAREAALFAHLDAAGSNPSLFTPAGLNETALEVGGGVTHTGHPTPSALPFRPVHC